jgi:branched-chain amino acid transport system permease protein
MSAAQWRAAMNSGARAQAAGTLPRAVPTRAQPRVDAPIDPNADAPAWVRWIWDRVGARHVFGLAFLLLYPWIASPFFTYQIGAQSLVLGLIALSLTFLGGYGGMTSLAQMTVAGVAGYAVAIFGTSATETSLNWPWWLAVLMAIIIAVIIGTFVGWLSVRTEGIYTIMITLAFGTGFYYLALQNYSVFNGFQGFQKVYPPQLWGIYWRDPIPFFYLTLVCCLLGYFAVKYIIRSPFGIALQGVRDNPRRMNSLGFNVTAHRIAAYAFSSILAAVAGVLLVWYNGLITPGSVGSSWMINILIIAVLGGMKHPIGPFIGAVIFVLLQNFAIDLIDRERFNLVIGGVFLVIVLFSPDGILGWWSKWKAKLDAAQAASNKMRPGVVVAAR